MSNHLFVRRELRSGHAVRGLVATIRPGTDNAEFGSGLGITIAQFQDGTRNTACLAERTGGPGRFTSPAGKMDADEYQGELSAVVDGQTFTGPFALR